MPIHWFIKPDGTAWDWGRNNFYSLWDGTTVTKSSPVAVLGGHSFVFVSTGGNNANSFWIKATGQIWVWWVGTASSGAATTSSQSSPVLVVWNHLFIKASNAQNTSAALKANGEIWTWWSGSALWDNTTTTKSSPVLVVGGHSFIDVNISAQSNDFWLKANGEIWSWGANTNGALWDGTVTARSSPVLVVGGHSFVKLWCGSNNNMSAALKADGSMWAWGGVTGWNGTSGFKSSPVLVVGSHSFVDIAMGNAQCYMRKANGEVWAIWTGTSGELGNNSATSRSSPVLVVGGHSFIEISSSCQESGAHALKSNGEVWSWGSGTDGRNGDNSTSNRSSPVLVVGSHTASHLFNVYSPPGPGPSSSIKTINGLALASVKAVNGLAIASVKTWDWLA